MDGFPSDQAALDIFAGGWASQMPARTHPSSPAAPYSSRATAPGLAASAFGEGGRLDGYNVCDLGPLEGGHTFQLERLGASVTAVECNAEAYLKCLIVKEIFNLKSKFRLGNFLTPLGGGGRAEL